MRTRIFTQIVLHCTVIIVLNRASLFQQSMIFVSLAAIYFYDT